MKDIIEKHNSFRESSEYKKEKTAEHYIKVPKSKPLKISFFCNKSGNDIKDILENVINKFKYGK